MLKNIYFLAFILLFVSCSKVKLTSRERNSFNEDWLFLKTDDTLVYKTDYDDSNWRMLELPHDWAIEGPFDLDYNSRTGGLPVFGKAWYRKHFTIDKGLEGNTINLEFDGIMSNSTLYVNGKKIYERPYGYIGFQIDISPYINFGKENIIAIELNPEILSSRWYPGAGIYRNVWFEVKNPIHVKHWGTHVVTKQLNDNQTEVQIETTIENNENYKGNFKIQTQILDKNGQQVSSVDSDFDFENDSEQTVLQKVIINNPNLWSFESPYLYTATSKIYINDGPIDDYNTTFGVRTIEFTREGFFLNGKREKINGVCLHHDLGPLGAAVNYRATERQLELMKAMGANAIRTSHNPASPEQLELCDKMGLLVQEEAFDCWKLPKVENGYNKDWDEWHEEDLRDMIKRDRNHPSIIMWSIGNEIKEQNESDGYLLARELVKICHEEDAHRPVTAGFNNFNAAVKNGLAAELDLVGANYKPTLYGKTRNEHPNWIVYGSETASCVSSRGIYYLPIKKYDKHESLQVSSYDVDSPGWAYPPDVEFHFQDSIPGVLGEFIWTGIDYLGEPTPYGGKDNLTHGKWDVDWPSRSSYFGAVDLAGFPKNRFYLYQSRWTKEPMVHILPHWNWENSGFTQIPVYCYTNCEEAELFLNGKSLGRKKIGVDKTRIPVSYDSWGKRPKYFDSPYRLSWDVDFEPGKLEVVGFRNGKEVARKSISTANTPNKIEMVADRNVINSDGKDLSFITVKIEDENLILCPMADNKVEFNVTGPAEIVAVGNGNAASIESFQANHRKAFNGLCLLVIKSKKGEQGEVKIEASSKGLKSKSINIKTENISLK